MFAYELERVTTQVRLVGTGTDGLGEDVSVFRGRHRALAPPSFDDTADVTNA